MLLEWYLEEKAFHLLKITFSNSKSPPAHIFAFLLHPLPCLQKYSSSVHKPPFFPVASLIFKKQSSLSFVSTFFPSLVPFLKRNAPRGNTHTPSLSFINRFSCFYVKACMPLKHIKNFYLLVVIYSTLI